MKGVSLDFSVFPFYSFFFFDNQRYFNQQEVTNDSMCSLQALKKKRKSSGQGVAPLQMRVRKVSLSRPIKILFPSFHRAG